MDNAPKKTTISAEESERRCKAIDRARAANIRAGYTHDPLLEAINDRFVCGAIDLEGFRREIDELVGIVR